jgi:hypothetical protein
MRPPRRPHMLKVRLKAVRQCQQTLKAPAQALQAPADTKVAPATRRQSPLMPSEHRGCLEPKVACELASMT